ncbi:MAG: AAA family ATPase [Candidatus Woesearchaeota archaeon]|nr:MAG: AAA family ATPase [Candidatus Woesearchaeota archaeon]
MLNSKDLFKTGIEGLDDILKGGLRPNSSLLVQGAPGTGKTILAIQFIYKGAMMGEAGLYITSEESADSLREYAKELGMDFTALEKKNLISIVEQPVLRGNIVSLDVPLKIIREKNVKRVVLDSLTLFQYQYPERSTEIRREILRFISSMKDVGVTLFATAEHKTADVDKMEFSPQDFLFDGLISLTRIRRGASYERCISVIKVRGQDHLIDIYPISIAKGGVKVHVDEIPFSLIEQDVSKRS